jgi:hypothetical protein
MAAFLQGGKATGESRRPFTSTYLREYKWMDLKLHSPTIVKACMLFAYYTERFIIFSVITNIYNKKTKGPTLMELFTATGKIEFFFLTIREVRC